MHQLWIDVLTHRQSTVLTNTRAFSLLFWLNLYKLCDLWWRNNWHGSLVFSLWVTGWRLITISPPQSLYFCEQCKTQRLFLLQLCHAQQIVTCGFDMETNWARSIKQLKFIIIEFELNLSERIMLCCDWPTAYSTCRKFSRFTDFVGGFLKFRNLVTRIKYRPGYWRDISEAVYQRRCWAFFQPCRLLT